MRHLLILLFLGHFDLMKLAYHTCLELSIVAHILEELEERCDLLLLHLEMEVLAELRGHSVVQTFELTAKNSVNPELGLAVPHILVERGPHLELEALNQVGIVLAPLKLALTLQESSVLVVTVLFPRRCYVVKEDGFVTFG
jgi:hypothetical protein